MKHQVYFATPGDRTMHPRIAALVQELRSGAASGADDAAMVARIKPIVQELVARPDWLEPKHSTCDEKQGFGVHILHEEPDHTLTVLVAAWLPGGGIPPHDHGTWSVVGGVRGTEKNIFWRRVDDGTKPDHAEIVQDSVIDLGPGKVISNATRDIHSVKNETSEVTVSLHVYGLNINHTDRYGFDPVKSLKKRLTVIPTNS